MKLIKLLRKLLVFEIVMILITLNFAVLPMNASAKNSASRDRDAIQDAISSGVTWLASQQNQDGSWGISSFYPVAYTAFVVTKLQEYAYENGYSPFDTDYIYQKNVINGWKFIFSTGTNNKPLYITKQPLSLQKHGTINNNPDSNSNGYGLDFGGSYTTGISLMALESTGTPNRPNDGGIDFNGDKVADTFFEIAQDVVDWIAFAQGDSGYGEGGWAYSYINNTSTSGDNSNSGYIVLGLAAGEEFGCTVPEWVRDRLNVWINNIQDPVNGDTNGYDGGSYYSPGGGSTNLLRTGNLIFQMTFYGDSTTSERFEAAVDYIERHWHGNYYSYQGWGYDLNVSYYQTMFCLMKGLEYSGIDYIDLDNDSYPEHNWYNEFASVLIAQQNINGSWPQCSYSYYDNILSTCWALLTLEKVIPPEHKKPREIPPIPNAGGPYIGYEGSAITFNGSGSKDLNGDTLEYRWDFDSDGLWETNWSLEPNATYTFGDDWFGMALLNVREINTTNNYTTLDRAFVTVKNVAPTLYTMQNFTINENKSFTLYANSFDPGSDDLSFEWHWGKSYLSNNLSTYLNSPPASDPYPSLDVNPRNVDDSVINNLIDNGVYRVTVTVTDDDGAVNFKNIFITVDIPPPENITPIEPPKDKEPPNQPPEAIVKGNPLTGEATLSVNLKGYGIDIDGIIVSYFWDFGDGQTYSNLVYFPNNTLNSNFFHRYKEPGIYRVEFTVMDDSGATDNDTLTITVHDRPLEGEAIFTISGYVYKASTAQRIAQVYISTINISILTDHSGFYSIKVPGGKYTLNVSKNGYESTSATISVSSDTKLDFHLRPLKKTPKEARSTMDTFWDWSWVLVFMIIITCLFFVGVIKRKKSTKKVQHPEPETIKPKANLPRISGPIVASKSIIKQPTLAASTLASTSTSTKPLLPKPQTPKQIGTTPTIAEDNNSK